MSNPINESDRDHIIDELSTINSITKGYIDMSKAFNISAAYLEDIQERIQNLIQQLES